MVKLQRSLGLFDATMINVGVMVGSAVFLTAGDVARALPHPTLQLAAWAVAALFSLAGALTLAELGATLPRAGGLYVYLREAFSPAVGFFYGWALFAVIQTASIAAVAIAMAAYLAHFVALSLVGQQWVGAAMVALFTGLNVLGVRGGIITQNIVTVAKLGVMLGLVALAFGGGAGHASNLWAAPEGARSPATLAVFGAALIGPLFAFDGWITTSYMGGELEHPERNVARTAVLSVAIVTTLYLVLNAAYLYVLGSERVAAGSLTATDTALALIGPRGADLIAGLVVVSILGALNGNILAGARVYYAMADEGLFFRQAAHIHPRLGTPAASLVAQALVSIGLVFTGRFEQLLTSCLFASWLFYALGGIAVFRLRRRPDLMRPYSVWGYPVVPALFVAFAGLLLASTVAAAPRDAAIGAALLATGVPAYYLFRRRARS